MPIWLYQIRPLFTVLVVMVFVETLSLLGLWAARRFILPKIRYSENVNDAISGTVQAIGVFYGITVGLIAVGVWNTNSNAADLVSKEASAIATLYEDISGYPTPMRDELGARIRQYTVFVIDEAWPAQKIGKGQTLSHGREIIDTFQHKLYSFEPATPGQVALHNETLKAFNNLIDSRRLRIDAVDSGLSGVMWAVIWAGAAFSIGVAYFFKVEDGKLHAVLVALMAGFLSLVVLMIIVNDKPFYGYGSISSDPYKLILYQVIDSRK